MTSGESKGYVVVGSPGQRDVRYANIGTVTVRDNGALMISQPGRQNDIIGVFAPGTWVRLVSEDRATTVDKS